MYNFSQITLLVTHFNRSRSLENLLQSFEALNCIFADIVISDDGSKHEHLHYINVLKTKYPIRVIQAVQNKGLGNNINKGQDEVRTPYTLYVQEDFEALPIFPQKLADSFKFMEDDRSLDIIRFWAYSPYPYLEPVGKGFSEMKIKPFATDYTKIYCYGDTPHLRRSNFFERFGRYAEGLSGDRTEYKMCISFIQNKGRGLFYNECRNLFTHENSPSEPSTMVRVSWRQGNNWLLKRVRNIYRQVKYNYDILMMPGLRRRY